MGHGGGGVAVVATEERGQVRGGTSVRELGSAGWCSATASCMQELLYRRGAQGTSLQCSGMGRRGCAARVGTHARVQVGGAHRGMPGHKGWTFEPPHKRTSSCLGAAAPSCANVHGHEHSRVAHVPAHKAQPAVVPAAPGKSRAATKGGQGGKGEAARCQPPCLTDRVE